MNAKTNALLKAISLSIVLLSGMVSVHAGEHPDHPDRPDRAERREARIEHRQEQQQRRAENQERKAENQERRAEQQGPAEGSAEAGKKSGRMTPEERRALRRQINEAGQDIYTRKN